MNGISLAALLGAATWFSSKLSGEDTETASGEPTAAPPPDIAEYPVDQYEFIWPPNPLFQ